MVGRLDFSFWDKAACHSSGKYIAVHHSTQNPSSPPGPPAFLGACAVAVPGSPSRLTWTGGSTACSEVTYWNGLLLGRVMLQAEVQPWEKVLWLSLCSLKHCPFQEECFMTSMRRLMSLPSSCSPFPLLFLAAFVTLDLWKTGISFTFSFLYSGVQNFYFLQIIIYKIIVSTMYWNKLPEIPIIPRDSTLTGILC